MARTNQSYRRNHYVPQWYQKRFLPTDQHELFYLDLKPEPFHRGGRTIKPPDKWRRGVKHCFIQDDLYTTNFSGIQNTEIEQFFFGGTDNNAPEAFDFWERYDHTEIEHSALEVFLTTMSLQRLRTPRGLEWLRKILATENANAVLIGLQRFQNLFCATWTDAVWSIADASASNTKFILTDNPVTFYNRDCFPGSRLCQKLVDPDIRWAGTQTVFALSAEKALLMTNLTWVRNPYQNPMRMGPNERLFRSPIFSFLDVQIGRELSEEEVIEINYILKRRADRFIAASQEAWLFPEENLRTDHWRKLGDGYLLMPDPRHVHMGGTVSVGYTGGGYDHWNEYGHKPWEPEFENKKRDEIEGTALSRFQAEWSAMMGPSYRGLPEHFARNNIVSVSEDLHARYLRDDEDWREKPGEKARRRGLRRPASPLSS